MSQNDDCYRSENWSEEDQKHFELKLNRARGSYNKAQYLRIKASAISDSKNPEIRKAARSLFKRVISDYSKEVDSVKTAYFQLGESFQADGDLTQAEENYRECIAYDKKYKETYSSEVMVELALAQLLADSKDVQKNKEAEKIFTDLASRKHYFEFNSEKFNYYFYRAKLASKLEKHNEASEFAELALNTAEEGKIPQFSRHPRIGLVQTTEEIMDQLKRLASL